MKKLIILHCFIGMTAFAGNPADSLKLALTKATGKEKVTILNQLSVALRSTEPKKALQYSDLAYTSAMKINDSLGMATSIKNSGVAWYFMGDYTHAIPDMKKALAIFEKLANKSGTSACISNLGLFFNDKSDYKNALIYFGKSLKIDNEMKDTDGITASMNNIGMVYYNQGNYIKALQYYLKAIELGKKTGNEERVAECWINVGSLYEQNKKYPEAIQAYSDAHLILKKHNNQYKDAICLNNIGMINYDLKEYAKAKIFMEQSISIRTKISDTIGIAACMKNLSSVYDALGDTTKALDCFFKAIRIEIKLGLRKKAARSLIDRGISLHNKGELDKAIPYFLNSLEFATGINAAPEMRDNYKNLAEIYAEQKDYKNAYKYNHLYSLINDSLLTLNSGLFSADTGSISLSDTTALSSATGNASDKESVRYNKTINWALFILLIVFSSLYIRERRNRKKGV
jgi:tetratricopeptide (TPR) repeat protein